MRSTTAREMTSIAEALKKGESILADGGIAEPRREAASLLEIATEKTRTSFYADPGYVLSSDQEELFDTCLQRRASREPLQYISGVQEFYGLEFEVTPDTLIPRPETEMVVERAIQILDGNSAPFFCEIGVGSGCISISILSRVPGAAAVGLDISTSALEIARMNAEKHSVIERIALRESDVFAAVADEQFDLIVSNPPYVPLGDLDGLQAEVRDFEPHVALAGGPDGLSIIRRIIDEAPRFLGPQGFVLLEIGFDQSGKVAALFDSDIWQQPELFPDLQGIPRLVAARRI